MSVQEILAEIPSLSFEERLQLIETLSRSLRADRQVRGGKRASELLGILKTDGPTPTDEELREDYTNYLMEMYS
jgi:hypothetical protein